MRTSPAIAIKAGLRAAALLATAAFATPAGAEKSPYALGGYVGYTQLSRPFGVLEADHVTSLALIASLDQRISRQRVFGDLRVVRSRYATNDELSYTGYSLDAGLDWQTAGNLSGELRAKADRTLLNYSPFEVPTGRRNLVSTRQLDAVARVGASSKLGFEAGAGLRHLDYSEPAYAQRQLRVGYGAAGVRWRPGPDASFGLAYRDTRGRYPGFVDATGAARPDHYNRRDVDLDATVDLSGFTQVYARASATRIGYEQQQDLDFAGTTGLLRLTWRPGAKLTLSAEAARDRGSDLQFQFDANPAQPGGGSFLQTDARSMASATRLRADYAATAKLSFNAGASRSRQPAVVQSSLPSSRRTEDGTLHTTQYVLGAAWTPTRTSRIGCDWTRDTRRARSSLDSFDVAYRSFGCYAQLSIEP